MGSPRIDAIESNQGGLSVSLRTPVVNLTYRTATTATGTPSAGLFHSTIVGRSKMTDLSNDLLPRFGVDRVMTQSLQEVQNEFGPNGERVFKPINDQHDAVRFVGSFVSATGSIDGPRPIGTSVGDFLEITFYGTGLNILPNSGAVYSVAVDGVSAGTLTLPTMSAVLFSRNYAPNIVISAVSGLSLGIHTVRLTLTSGSVQIYGYEILNTNSTLQYTPGSSTVNGKLLTASSLTTASYNAGFESGSLGTKGGCVLVYQKSDGTIAKALTPTRSSAPTYLSSITTADRADEEVVRTYHWREFGCGRNPANGGQAFDDFSSLTTTTSDRAFTLDDGTTTLVINDGFMSNSSNGETIGGANSAGSYIIITFVGTGLDIARGAITGNPSQVYIDGVSQGQITKASANKDVQKICSGLPYGTHTVKFDYVSAGASHAQIEQFIVYAPKTPSLPSGAVALGQYYLMGDYSPASSAQVTYVSPGILRKGASREVVYSSTWNVVLNVLDLQSGWNFNTTTIGSYVEYTFFGTGIEYHGIANNTAAINYTVLMDGLALNTGSNTGSTVTYTVGTTTTNTGVANNGLTLSAAGTVTGTSTYTGNTFIRISGLTLGRHTIRITQNTSAASANLYGDVFDIITPVHTPAFNGLGVIQNTLSVGSCTIMDKRSFDAKQIPTIKPWAQAVGATNNPSNAFAINVPGPCPDLSTTIKTSGGPLAISATCSHTNTSVAFMQIRIYVNGVLTGAMSEAYMDTATAVAATSTSVIVQVSAGTHKIDAYWMTNTGTMTGNSTNRQLNVREL